MVVRKRTPGAEPAKPAQKNTLEPHKYFYAANGTVLKDLDDLRRFLATVDERTFRHHVHERDGKRWNDFSNWVRDVFANKTLAKSLLECRDATTMRLKLERS